MNPISAFAVFFIIWWITLFAVLPLGFRSQADAGEVTPGTHESAPAKPRFAFIVSLNTLISMVIFAAFYWFAITKGLRFDDLADFIPQFMKVPGAAGS